MAWQARDIQILRKEVNAAWMERSPVQNTSKDKTEN